MMAYLSFLEIIPEEHQRVDLGKKVQRETLEHILIDAAGKIGYQFQNNSEHSNCHGQNEKVYLFSRFFFPDIMVTLKNVSSITQIYICYGESISRKRFKEKIEEYKKEIMKRVRA